MYILAKLNVKLEVQFRKNLFRFMTTVISLIALYISHITSNITGVFPILQILLLTFFKTSTELNKKLLKLKHIFICYKLFKNSHCTAKKVQWRWGGARAWNTFRRLSGRFASLFCSFLGVCVCVWSGCLKFIFLRTAHDALQFSLKRQTRQLEKVGSGRSGEEQEREQGQ